jgi:ParB/RepB/Spo0J family partition protein
MPTEDPNIPQSERKVIAIDNISVGLYQVRVADFEGDDFEELKACIRVLGLLQGIGVTESQGGEAEYECIYGQRRLSAFRELADVDSSFSEIAANYFPGPLTLAMGKAISLAENVTQKQMTSSELTDALTDAYKLYGSYAEVERQTGCPRSLVTKHVKFARLPPSLKTAVEQGGMAQNTALAIANAAESPAGYDDAKIEELRSALPDLDDVAQKKLLKRAKAAPRVKVKTLMDNIDEPDPTARIVLVIDQSINQALMKASQDREEDSPQETAIQLIIEGLSKENALN